ncbi:TIGR02452 family protein [Butyrivibrio sp. AE2032]|uniref:TIGR02452 family protein n=1 Tax=Butyrivibrio sp. AE2032 TaxID=1458463 RepID=UPI0005557F2F|nr:TIGR02452 family protein [Butyrivibrio sp. AE2032]
MGWSDRDARAKVFEDTRLHYMNDASLKDVVEDSVRGQKLILEKDATGFDHSVLNENDTKIVVSRKRSFEAASEYSKAGLKTAVHNFASSTNPGGGVVTGAGAQEECLCRCSTLYPCLDVKEMWDGFYKPHRKTGDPLHNGDIIYTPGVVVFKTDTALPEMMPEKEWYSVDVITCAAPNLRSDPSNRFNPSDGAKRAEIGNEALKEIHVQRLSRMLEVAVVKGCEAVILGAFGCGAFRNPPEVAAEAARIAVDQYGKYFKVIEFAVYCSPNDLSNYSVFNSVFG